MEHNETRINIESSLQKAKMFIELAQVLQRPWMITSIAQDIETVQLGFSVGLLTTEEAEALVEYVTREPRHALYGLRYIYRRFNQ